MKKRSKLLLAALTVALALLTAGTFYFARERRSIAIIGGADGPTAIFVTTT